MKLISSIIRGIQSRRQKTPFFFLEITGEGVITRYSIFRRDITYGGNLYQAGLAYLNSFQYSSDLSSDPVNLSLRQTANTNYLSYIMSTRIPVITIKIFKAYYEGSTTITEALQVFEGTLKTVRVTSTVLQFEFIPRLFRLDNSILRVATRISCSHRLYGPQCSVDPNGSYAGRAFRTSVTISAFDVGQKKLTTDLSTAHPEYTPVTDYFVGGVASFTVNGETFVQRLHILSQDGDDIYVLGSFVGLNVTDPLNRTVTLQAGCKFNLDSCTNKFGNFDGNGNARILAFPLIPPRNPSMDGLA